MPTYQYRCSNCGEQFELWQSIHDESITRHDRCGGDVQKVLGVAGIVLKGSGFYRTDSRSGNGKDDKSEKTETGDSGAKSEPSPSKPSTEKKSGSESKTTTSGSTP